MEELKLLIDMVANLPQMALWVQIGLLGYKVAVIGSIYGVIRLLIVKTHDWLTRPRAMTLGKLPINEETYEALNFEIKRLVRGSNYIHMSDVVKLRKAIDATEGKP